MLLFSLLATLLFSCTFGFGVNNACSNLLLYPFSFLGHNCYYNFNVYSNISSIIERNGYVAENFDVTTQDGYILTVFRIRSKTIASFKTPVFLQHGILHNSLAWVDKSNQSLAFWLADRGYDVFLGNFRGSTYSQTHTKYSIHNPKFWNFTNDIIAENDLFVMLNLVASINKSNKKIIYIGHSLATTSVFMLASRFPDKVENLLEVIVAFAPVVYLHGSIPILTAIGLPFTDLLLFFNIKGFFYQEKTFHAVFTTLAQFLPFAIKGFYNFLFGSSNQFLADYLILFWNHFPSGNSLYQFQQYFQFAKSGQFQMYDFGKKKNIKYYNSETPPQYNLSNVKTPTHLFYTTQDLFYNEDNIQKLYNELGASTKSLHQVGPNNTEYKFNHMDFLYGANLIEVLYKKVILLLQ